MSLAPLDIQHDEKVHKFFALIDGQEAHVTYALAGDHVRDFQHTFVPEELRGKRIADQIVRFALDDTLREGYRFIPTCPFVHGFVERHPEYRKGVTEG